MPTGKAALGPKPGPLADPSSDPAAPQDEEESTIDPEQYSDLADVQEILGKYWAAEKDGPTLWDTLQEKRRDFFTAYDRRGMTALSRMVFSQYFGMSPGWSGGMSNYDTQTISFAGEDGEQIVMNVNEFRSFVDQIIGMMTKNRPAFQAQAINTDYASLAQVEASDAMIRYFYEQVFGEIKEKEFVKIEALYGKSYVHVQWDPDGGRDVQIDIEVPSPQGPLPGKKTVKSGEFILSKCYPWQVITEPFRSEHDEHFWRLVDMPRRSKYQMMARYPLFAKQLDESENLIDEWEFRFPGADPNCRIPDDSCSVSIFYHARSAVLPKGRKCVFVNGILVEDSEDGIGIDDIPVVPLMSCELHGTSFGVSDLWNLIPLEQMQNQVLSDMASNMEAFGRPPFMIPEGADIDLDALANGQKVIFIPAGMQEGSFGAMKFPQIPDVSFKLIELLRMYKQSVSMLNAISRGETSTNITSGAHAALYSQIALEAQSPREVQVDLARERIANLLLQYLKLYASHPQMVAITGVDERPYLKALKQEDIAGVHRVVVKSANPALKTIAGKTQIAQLIASWPAHSPLQDPKQIIELITSGQLKPSYNSTRTDELRIRYENEQLMMGPPTQTTIEPDPTTGMMVAVDTVPSLPVYPTDNARDHILGLKEVLASPAAQQNPKVLAAAQAHLLDHVRKARFGDEYLAMLIDLPLPQQLMQPQQPEKPTGATQSAVKGADQTNTPPQDDTKNDKLGQLPSPPKPPQQVSQQPS